jgi:hypothetical protein
MCPPHTKKSDACIIQRVVCFIFLILHTMCKNFFDLCGLQPWVPIVFVLSVNFDTDLPAYILILDHNFFIFFVFSVDDLVCLSCLVYFTKFVDHEDKESQGVPIVTTIGVTKTSTRSYVTSNFCIEGYVQKF